MDKAFSYIDAAIKKAWIKGVQKDYFDYYILKEDSLKNSFYHHIRMNLTDQYMMDNNIRIYTEYYLYDNQRADIAIVKIDELGYHSHLSEKVTDVIAIIELKHKNGHCSMEPFIKDIAKVKKVYKEEQTSLMPLLSGFHS